MRLRSRPHATTDLRITYRQSETRRERVERVAKQRLLAARGLADMPPRAWVRWAALVAWSLLVVVATASATRLVVSGSVRGGPVYTARQASSQNCTGANVTTATFASRYSAAVGGDVLCLTTGAYGEFAGSAKSSPGVTITPASGQAPTMTMNTSGTASWITLDGIKITGGISHINGGTTHYTVKNAEFANQLIIDGLGTDFNNSAITLGPNVNFTMNDDTDGNTALDEGRVTIKRDDDGTTPSGILFTGDTWGNPTAGHTALGNGAPPSGCWDGILANAGGWTVEDSTFANMTQGPVSNDGFCQAHVDSVSFFAGNNGTYRNVTFTRVYIYESQSGIVDYDSHGINVVVQNSAFQTIPPYGINPCAAVCVKGSADQVVSHNTFRDAEFQYGWNNHGTQATGGIATDNIFDAPPTLDTASDTGETGTPTFAAQHHNWCVAGTCTGTGSLNGAPAPSWIGGATPTTYAGYKLSPGTRGTGVASDATDIGVNP